MIIEKNFWTSESASKNISTLDLHITTEVKWSIMLVHPVKGTLYYQSNYNTKILQEKASLE